MGAMPPPMPPAREPAIRSYVSRYFGLELEGLYAGFLRSAEGGNVKAELVAQAVGGMPVKAKHIGIPQIEAFNVSVGMAMSKSFWTWLEKAWKGEAERRHGTLQACNHKLDVMHENEFWDALVTETSFPALDGSSKDPFYMGIKFQAERVAQRILQPGAKKVKGNFDMTQKKWVPSMFKLTMDGLDCTHVNKIDAFTIKQGTKKVETGPDRVYQLEPTNLEYPNLSITMSMSHAASWLTWHDDFVLKGNNTPDKEKSGHIVLMSSNRQELMDITLKQCGIYNMVPDKSDAGSDAIRRVKVDIYVEEMEIKYLG
jgi:hypothetical protein